MTAPARDFYPQDQPPVDYADFILGKEGNHLVALVPGNRGGYAYALLYFQPVTGCFVVRGISPKRQAILSLLWRLECAHAGPLGWPDDPRFGLHLHGLISGSSYPDDASALSASDVAAISHFLEWCCDGLQIA